MAVPIRGRLPRAELRGERGAKRAVMRSADVRWWGQRADLPWVPVITLARAADFPPEVPD